MRKIRLSHPLAKLFLLLILIVVGRYAFSEQLPGYKLSAESIPENIGIYTQYIEDKDGILFLKILWPRTQSIIMV
jgi:hypothetical protein